MRREICVDQSSVTVMVILFVALQNQVTVMRISAHAMHRRFAVMRIHFPLMRTWLAVMRNQVVASQTLIAAARTLIVAMSEKVRGGATPVAVVHISMAVPQTNRSARQLLRSEVRDKGAARLRGDHMLAPTTWPTWNTCSGSEIILSIFDDLA